MRASECPRTHSSSRYTPESAHFTRLHEGYSRRKRREFNLHFATIEGTICEFFDCQLVSQSPTSGHAQTSFAGSLERNHGRTAHENLPFWRWRHHFRVCCTLLLSAISSEWKLWAHIFSANLSDQYFVNRQDRYVLIERCPALADFYSELVTTVAECSFTLNADGSISLHDECSVHPFEGTTFFNYLFFLLWGWSFFRTISCLQVHASPKTIG